jgi:uncharacterized membrane protein (DUF106 family)
MNKTIKSTLKFFNLLDQDSNCLSLTNCLIYLAVFYIAVNPHIDLTALGAFVTILMNYAHKRSIASKAQNITDLISQFQTRLDKALEESTSANKEMQNKINSLQLQKNLTGQPIIAKAPSANRNAPLNFNKFPDGM